MIIDSRWPHECFQPVAPASKGHGKWSVLNYGYNPNPEHLSKLATKPTSSHKDEKESIDLKNMKPITWGFARKETDNVEFIRKAMMKP